MQVSFLAKIQTLRRVAIPIETYKVMMLEEGQIIEVTIKTLDKVTK